MTKQYRLAIYVTYEDLPGAEAGHVLKDYGAISTVVDDTIRQTLSAAAHHLAQTGRLSAGGHLKVATWSGGIEDVTPVPEK
jgi:hypothetical protein